MNRERKVMDPKVYDALVASGEKYGIRPFEHVTADHTPGCLWGHAFVLDGVDPEVVSEHAVLPPTGVLYLDRKAVPPGPVTRELTRLKLSAYAFDEAFTPGWDITMADALDAMGVVRGEEATDAAA